MWPIRSAVTIAALSLVACGPLDGLDWLRRPLEAICTVDVIGAGTKQVETDYIPHVVACENGAADSEALKAQAVAARSYMHYKVNNEGSICDGTKCQVYTCANKPQQRHYDAAKATAGQVLMWDGVVICAFYVAGAKPSTASCVPLPTDEDPTGTEKWVTYNEGKSGSDVTQSDLGWVDPGNKFNRGCKSQNGAHCLSLKGRPYPEILRFYYGADIQLVTAVGSCVEPPLDAGPPDGLEQDLRPQGDQLTPVSDSWAGDGLPPDWEPDNGGDGGCGCVVFAKTPRDSASWSLLLLVLMLIAIVFRRVRP
jgi:hypothetical protein